MNPPRADVDASLADTPPKNVRRDRNRPTRPTPTRSPPPHRPRKEQNSDNERARQTWLHPASTEASGRWSRKFGAMLYTVARTSAASCAERWHPLTHAMSMLFRPCRNKLAKGSKHCLATGSAGSLPRYVQRTLTEATPAGNSYQCRWRARSRGHAPRQSTMCVMPSGLSKHTLSIDSKPPTKILTPFESSWGRPPWYADRSRTVAPHSRPPKNQTNMCHEGRPMNKQFETCSGRPFESAMGDGESYDTPSFSVIATLSHAPARRSLGELSGRDRSRDRSRGVTEEKPGVVRPGIHIGVVRA